MKHANIFYRGTALLLTLVMALTLLAGCGNEETPSSSTTSNSSISSTVEESSSETSQLKPEPRTAEESSASDQDLSQTEEVKNITFTVVHKDGSKADFPISTTATNLRQALEEEGLISGEESSYGLFVTTVDGETADDSKEEWWCLTKGGEMWNYGVDDTEIQDGDAFEFTLTVGY